MPRHSGSFKENGLPRFVDYLHEVQVRSGLAPMPLIRDWTRTEKVRTAWGIRSALRQTHLIRCIIPNLTGTNQSKGNQVATYFLTQIAGNLPPGYSMSSAPGKGYPDQIISFGGCGFCMEMKATSEWKPNDTNRSVLTSSPLKMRALIVAGLIDKPPAHLVCYVIYDTETAQINSVRLDFLEPDSEIAIRLEASTSHRALDRGKHLTRRFF